MSMNSCQRQQQPALAEEHTNERKPSSIGVSKEMAGNRDVGAGCSLILNPMRSKASYQY